jgi:membrane-associated phospholipid phosphatase
MAGRRDAATLDRIAYWDAGAAPYRWTEAAIEWAHVRSPLAGGEQRRAFALVTVAMHDVWIANQDAKFAYWQLRPNQLDPALTTVFPTPNHPSYPSNRSTHGSATEVLAHFFPRDAALFRQLGEEIGESAVWAGIHFRSDVVAGSAMGRAVARLLLDRVTGDA